MGFIENIKAVPITDYAQRCGFTLVQKGQRYVSLKEHDSVMIDTYKNCFYRNSVFQKGQAGGAGSIIDFAMEFKGLDRKQAIRELSTAYGISADREPNYQTYKPMPKVPEPPKRAVGDLDLPPKADNMRAVYRYLQGERKIDQSVVRYFAAKNMLYQDAKHNNCVFVSPSKRFACLRSTGGKRFAIDVKGCDYNECFFFRPSEKARTLVVAESVIDVMSIMTQFAREGKRYTDYSYLALTGTNKLPSMFYHLEKESDIDNIMLAFDNDKAGQEAQEAAVAGLNERNFSGAIEIFTAPAGKDWNDYIKSTTDQSGQEQKNPSPHRDNGQGQESDKTANQSVKDGMNMAQEIDINQIPIEAIAMLDYVNNPDRRGIFRASAMLESVINQVGSGRTGRKATAQGFDELSEIYRRYDAAWTDAHLKDDFQSKVAILQLREGEENHSRRFLSMEHLERTMQETPNCDNYELVYVRNEALEQVHPEMFREFRCGELYAEFNADTLRPRNYYGHSLSMGDVIVFANDFNEQHAYYVDDVGFKKLPDNFLTHTMIARIRNDLDIRQENLLYNDVILYQAENVVPIMDEAANDRQFKITSEYSHIFELADRRGMIMDMDELGYDYDFAPGRNPIYWQSKDSPEDRFALDSWDDVRYFINDIKTLHESYSLKELQDIATHDYDYSDVIPTYGVRKLHTAIVTYPQPEQQKEQPNITVLFKDENSGLEAGINVDGDLYFGGNGSGYNLPDTVENRQRIEADIERYTGQKADLVGKDYRFQVQTIYEYEEANNIPENDRMTKWSDEYGVSVAKPWYKENDPSVMDRAVNDRHIGISEALIAQRYAEIVREMEVNHRDNAERAEALAGRLDDFVFDFDTYEYHDTVGVAPEEREAHRAELVQSVTDEQLALAGEREANYVYLFGSESGVWSAEVLSESRPGGVRMMAEQSYPVGVYYYRTDINGSGIVEYADCQNREELLDLLNFLGGAGFSVISAWDFDRDQCADEINDLFNAGYHRRVELIRAEAERFNHRDNEEQEVVAQPETNQPLTSEDVTNIKGVSMEYNEVYRSAIYTFEGDIRGEHDILTYIVSQRDDGEDFSIHTEIDDIWERMSPSELRKLETVLSREATYFTWEQRINDAKTIDEVLDVREWLTEAENQNMTKEQYEKLYNKMDERQRSLDGATITFYVAEGMEFPILGEYHEGLTLKEAFDIYEQIPAERLNGGKGIGFDLQDGTIYSGHFDLMQGGVVREDVINLVEHYRNSPLVQQAIQDCKDELARRNGQEREEAQSTEVKVEFAEGEEATDLSDAPAEIKEEILRNADELSRREQETIYQEQEAVYRLDSKIYLHIQVSDEGYDYTLYDKDMKDLDGGQLDNPELTLVEARNEVLALHGMRDMGIETFDLSTFEEMRDAADKLLFAVRESTEVERIMHPDRFAAENKEGSGEMIAHEKLLEIEAMYERNHGKDTWYKLSDDEKADYFNKNIFRVEAKEKKLADRGDRANHPHGDNEQEQSIVASGKDGENITWTLINDGTLTISGTGEMSDAPWRKYFGDIKSVIIQEGVTVIGGGAFSGCSSLQSVSIPKGVTEIGYGAFYECSSLRNVSIPESVTEIGGGAFSGCSSLQSVSIPKGVTTIEFRAFERCSGLQNISIPESVTEIRGFAFADCSGLKEVSIPEGVTEIEFRAFEGCVSLQNISIPESMTVIGGGAFSGIAVGATIYATKPELLVAGQNCDAETTAVVSLSNRSREADHHEDAERPNTTEISIDGHVCRLNDEWESNGTSYVVGQDTEDEIFYYARVNEDGKTYEYEFDSQPTREDVESHHVDYMSQRDIDRHEAVPHLNDEPKEQADTHGDNKRQQEVATSGIYTPAPNRYYEPDLDLDGTADELFTQARNGYIENPEALAKLQEILSNPVEQKTEEAFYVGVLKEIAEDKGNQPYVFAQMKKDILDGVNPEEVTLRDGLTLEVFKGNIDGVVIALTENNEERDARGVTGVSVDEFLNMTAQDFEEVVNAVYAYNMVVEEREEQERDREQEATDLSDAPAEVKDEILHNAEELERREQEKNAEAVAMHSAPVEIDPDLSPKDQLQQRLENGIRSVLDGEQFKNWLSTGGKLFYNNYSFRNAMLVWLQKPDASYVMGYEKWKDFGRNVAQGATGAKVFIPIMAYEKSKGGLFRSIKSNLTDQLSKNPSLGVATYRLGTSKLEFTMNRANHAIGIKIDGVEREIFGSDEDVKRFLDRNVIGKLPTGYTVGTVFDAKDVIVPEYLWMKSGFTKEEVVTDEKGNPVKNRRGETKIVNTPERQARFQTDLDTRIASKDPEKMQHLFDACVAASERKGVPVYLAEKADDEILNDGAKGYFSRKFTEDKPNGFIVIDNSLEITEKCATLLHEMGHADLHKNLEALAQKMGEERISKSMKEVQAEAVAFSVASTFGIETDTSSFHYLAAYSRGFELQDFQKSLDVIYRETQALTADIKAELDIRGFNLDLTEKPKEMLDKETLKTLSTKYMDFAAEQGSMVQAAFTELPDFVKQSKDNPELMEVLKYQKLNLDSRQADLETMLTAIENLNKADTREQQDELINALDTKMNRISGDAHAFEVLVERYVVASEQVRGGLKVDFDKDPVKTLEAMKKDYPTLPKLSRPQLEYIATSKFVSRELSKLLRNNPQAFVDKVTERAALLPKIAAKNGTFVEVSYCEQWTENPIFEKGTLCSPKIADMMIAGSEAQIRGFREEAEKRCEYFPYAKCDITIYTPNKHGGLNALETRVDIGDGAQTSLKDHLEQVCVRGAERKELLANFQEALTERANKNKITVQDISVNPHGEHHDSEKENTKDGTFTQEQWDEKIRDRREQAGQVQTGREHSRPDMEH